MSDGLPIATTGNDEDPPRCPWCAKDPGEASFTLADLTAAHDAGLLTGFVQREPDGQAPPGAAVADCPHCCRPFVLRLHLARGFKFVRLIPVLTPTDVKFLRRGQ